MGCRREIGAVRIDQVGPLELHTKQRRQLPHLLDDALQQISGEQIAEVHTLQQRLRNPPVEHLRSVTDTHALHDPDIRSGRASRLSTGKQCRAKFSSPLDTELRCRIPR